MGCLAGWMPEMACAVENDSLAFGDSTSVSQAKKFNDFCNILQRFHEQEVTT